MPSPSYHEKLRRDNLERNEAFLKSIGIDGTKKRLKSSAITITAPKQESIPRRAKRHKIAIESEPFIPRRSTRSNPSASNSKPDDVPVPIDKRVKPMENLLDTDEGLAAVSTSHLLLSLASDLSSDNGVADIADRGYETNLRAMFSRPGGHFAKNGDEEDNIVEEVPGGRPSIIHKSRTQEDISKVTKTRLTELIFHPCTHKTVLLGGDHTGHVGLWDASSSTTTTNFLCRPHTNSVSGLHVHRSQPSTLWSVSLDKSIRWSDLEQEQFVESYRSDTAIRCTAFVSPNLLYAAGDKGFVHAVDPRKSGAAGWVHQAHEKNIRSIHIHPQREHLILSSTGGGDGCISFHDTRMVGKKVWKAVVEIEGCNQVNHVAVSPDGQYMVCVAQDDTLSTWRCEDVLKGTAIQPQKRSYFVNNSDNRKWLSTIRPVFDQTQPHSFVIGSMEDERCINFFTLGGKGEEDHVTSALKYCDEKSFLNTLCPRLACHPSATMVAAGNSSGKVYLLR